MFRLLQSKAILIHQQKSKIKSRFVSTISLTDYDYLVDQLFSSYEQAIEEMTYLPVQEIGVRFDWRWKQHLIHFFSFTIFSQGVFTLDLGKANGKTNKQTNKQTKQTKVNVYC